MSERTHCTYIMASRSHTLYVGVTGNLHRRVFQHKWHETGGFTARYNCDRLVWFESFSDPSLAIQREKELKGWRREKKIVLIEQTNPTWQDLSRDWYEYEPADYRECLGSDGCVNAGEGQPQILHSAEVRSVQDDGRWWW